MADHPKRAKAGDVLELKVGNRFAYVHYIGRHREYGDAVVVNPQLQDESASISGQYFSRGYVTFYPATAAVAQELVRVVGNLPPPELPERFRREGARSGRQVATWIVEDRDGEVVKATLSDDDLRLPIASIWNHEFLVQRVAEGWDPLQQGRELLEADAKAVREIAKVSDGETSHLILHYLYTPTGDTARQVASELRGSGFDVQQRLGADGVHWLVLARHEVVPTDQVMASIRRSMETLARTVGGEYDGWEAEVRRERPTSH